MESRGFCEEGGEAASMEGPAEDKGASKKKKMQEQGNEDMDEVAQVACRKCVFFLISPLLPFH